MTKIESYIDTLEKLKIDVKSHTAEIPCQLITEALDEAIKALQALASPLNAVIIPEGATNGDMIKAIFPAYEYEKHIRNIGDDTVEVFSKYGEFINDFKLDWWESPYEGGKKDE